MEWHFKLEADALDIKDILRRISALTLVRDRGSADIVQIIEDHERGRAASLSCPDTAGDARSRASAANRRVRMLPSAEFGRD